MITLLTRLADKAGTLGGVVSTMGCAMCFPAMEGAGKVATTGLDGVKVDSVL